VQKTPEATLFSSFRLRQLPPFDQNPDFPASPDEGGRKIRVAGTKVDIISIWGDF